MSQAPRLKALEARVALALAARSNPAVVGTRAGQLGPGPSFVVLGETTNVGTLEWIYAPAMTEN